MIALFRELTFKVTMRREALSFPAGIVIVVGTVANIESLEIETLEPPTGAGPFNETIATAAEPPVTFGGLMDKAERPGDFTINFAVFEPPPPVAPIVAVEFEETADV